MIRDEAGEFPAPRGQNLGRHGRSDGALDRVCHGCLVSFDVVVKHQGPASIPVARKESIEAGLRDLELADALSKRLQVSAKEDAAHDLDDADPLALYPKCLADDAPIAIAADEEIGSNSSLSVRILHAGNDPIVTLLEPQELGTQPQRSSQGKSSFPEDRLDLILS